MSACSKQFTLHVDVAMVCPTLDSQVVIPADFAGNQWSVYAPSTEVAHPNKYFTSGNTSVHVLDADSASYVRAVAIPGINGSMAGLASVFSPATNQIYFHTFNAPNSYLLALHVNTEAITASAADLFTYGWETGIDTEHSEIAVIASDPGSQKQDIYLFDAVTLALSSSFEVVAFADLGSECRGLDYDATRDRWYTCYANIGFGTSFIRGYSRTGVLQMNTDISALGYYATSLAYVPALDRIYARCPQFLGATVDHMIIVNPATGAVVGNVALDAAGSGGLGMVYSSGRNVLLLSGTNYFGIFRLDTDVMLCTFAIGADSTSGIFGTKLTNRNAAGDRSRYYS